jgi:hypothetical protein
MLALQPRALPPGAERGRRFPTMLSTRGRLFEGPGFWQRRGLWLVLAAPLHAVLEAGRRGQRKLRRSAG